MLLNSHYFDRSNFEKKSKYFDEKLCGTPGLLKDNFGGKVYSVLFQDQKGDSKAKGVKKILTEQYNIDQYIECLFNEHIHSCEYRSIRSIRHDLFTVDEKKIALSPWDDKRFWLLDASSSLAFGHKLIRRKPDEHTPRKKSICCLFP